MKLKLEYDTPCLALVVRLLLVTFVVLLLIAFALLGDPPRALLSRAWPLMGRSELKQVKGVASHLCVADDKPTRRR